MLGTQYDDVTGPQTVSGAQDLLEVLYPSDAAGAIDGIVVGKSGDATSEGHYITCSVITGAPTSGSGGGSVTPKPRSPGASSSGCTVERNNTTQLTGGTVGWTMTLPFNMAGGIDFIFDPPVEVPAGARFLVAMPAPTAPRTVHCNLARREIGGAP